MRGLSVATAALALSLAPAAAHASVAPAHARLPVAAGAPLVRLTPAGPLARPRGFHAAHRFAPLPTHGLLRAQARPLAPPSASAPQATAIPAPPRERLPSSAPAPSLLDSGTDPGGPSDAADPLPSWRPGRTKEALLRFVREASQPGGARAIPPQERLAVFDNDGTLWSEQPLYFPFQFCVDRIRAMAAPPPQWRAQEPYASALRGDVGALLTQGSSALGTLLPVCSAGLDTEAYATEVRRWLATARHPRTGLPYTAMVFQPMLELLALLRSAGFRTVIVSGGDTEFMRPWSEAVYGIPPEQVIGTRLALSWTHPPGQPPRLMRLPSVESVTDGPNKPIAIQQTLGRRPVAAFGNSDGDLQMLEWATAGSGARLALLVHHTDARREWAYDRDSRVGRLSRALDRARERGWIVVDMARDWLRVYPCPSQSP